MSRSKKSRHHSHSIWYRMRRWLRHNKKMAAGSAVICAAVILAAGVFLHREASIQRSRHVTASNSVDMKSGYRNIIWRGEEYQYNSLVTTILFAGVDSTGKLEATKQYGNKARADSIALVVMDQLHRKLTVIAINRDTMTKIRRYSMSGNDSGLYTTHIGYAYSYGDGGEVSCENLSEAVSLLFGNIPIHQYIVTNSDSMTRLNKLAGDITVTVPNNDLAQLHPELTDGATVTLDDNNLIDYLRYRDTEEEFSNEGRMERQKSYVTAYIQKLQGMSGSDIEKAWEELESMSDYLQTGIRRNQYLDLAKKLRSLEFSETDYEQLSGTDREGELHDEFYPDVEALQEKIIELFYLKV